MEKLYYHSYNAKTKYELVLNSTYSSDLLYYTNGSTELSVEFCVDEVIKDRGGLDMRRRRRGKRSSLGIPKAPQVKYSRRLKRLSLGMPRKASHLSSTSISKFSFSFRSCDMCESWSVFCA